MPSSSEASPSSARESSSPEPPKKKNSKRKRSEPVPKPADSDNSDSESDDGGDDSGIANATAIDSSEPVLSHAERRRQRRREKAAAVVGIDVDEAAPSKKRKLKDGTAASTASKSASAKRQNSVWVGNMSFKTTETNLRAFFKEAGEITRVHLPLKASARPNMPQENRGFAYVDFATPEAKTAAIALSEQPLVGRKLLIKDGGDFSGRPITPGTDIKTTDSALAQKTHSRTAQKILRNQKQPPGPTLFLGNLPFETTDDDIRALFEAHRLTTKQQKEKKRLEEEAAIAIGAGAARDSSDSDSSEDDDGDDGGDTDSESDEDADEGLFGSEKTGKSDKTKAEKAEKETVKAKKDDFILKIRMGTFEDTGQCKGFAFVDFSSIDNATSALINPKNHHFNGRDLKVEYAGADAVRRGAAKHLLPGYIVGEKKAPGDRGAAFGGGVHKSAGGVRSSYNAGPRGGGDRAHGGLESRDRGARARSSFDMEGGAEGGGGEGAVVEQGVTESYGGRREAFDRSGRDRKQRGGQREFKGTRARPKPGAALALAKRETFSIVPSQGKKVTF